MVQDPSSSFSNTRFSGIRIKHVPVGTVHFETLIKSDMEGSLSFLILYCTMNIKLNILYFICCRGRKQGSTKVTIKVY